MRDSTNPITMPIPGVAPAKMEETQAMQELSKRLWNYKAKRLSTLWGID